MFIESFKNKQPRIYLCLSYPHKLDIIGWPLRLALKTLQVTTTSQLTPSRVTCPSWYTESSLSFTSPSPRLSVDQRNTCKYDLYDLCNDDLCITVCNDDLYNHAYCWMVGVMHEKFKFEVFWINELMFTWLLTSLFLK